MFEKKDKRNSLYIGILSSSFDVFYGAEIISAVLGYIIYDIPHTSGIVRDETIRCGSGRFRFKVGRFGRRYVHKYLRFLLQDVEMFGPRQHK